MEFRHLRYVVALAEELSFSRAAERLHISQPPLSQQIQQLETELGVKLFDRSKRHVAVTEAGRVFVEEARVVLAQAGHAVEAAVRAEKGEIGELAIGTVTSANNDFYRVFIQILRRFAAQYPGIRIALRSLPTAQQVDALREGQIQVGFVVLPIDEPAVVTEIVRREPLMLALPERHRLARQRLVALTELADEPLILPDRHLSPPCYALAVRALHAAGVSPQIAHESDNIHTALALVAAGAGVSLKPASLRDMKLKGIVFRELKPPVPQIETGVAYRRDAHSSVLNSFLEIVRRNAPKVPGANGDAESVGLASSPLSTLMDSAGRRSAPRKAFT